MDWRKVVGANVKRLRLARKLTQEKVALDAEIDLTYMGGIERGTRNPSLLVMARVAKVLGVGPAQLMDAERPVIGALTPQAAVVWEAISRRPRSAADLAKATRLTPLQVRGAIDRLRGTGYQVWTARDGFWADRGEPATEQQSWKREP